MVQQINLVAIVKRENKNIGNPSILISSCVFLTAVFCAGNIVLLESKKTALENENAITVNKINSLKVKLNLLVEKKKETKVDVDIKNKIEGITREVETDTKFIDTINKNSLGYTNGYAETFKALSNISVPGLWLTEISVSGEGNTLNIKGKTLYESLIPIYIEKLHNQTVLQGAKFSTISFKHNEKEKPSDKDMLEFNLVSNIHSIDLSAIEKK